MNKAHITAKYKLMLEMVQDRNVAGANCYTCSHCGHITKTIDVDAGVTPFMHQCEKCGHMAESSLYNDIAIGVEPTEEWYRPTLEQVLKMWKKQPGLADHVLLGGLDCRKIETIKTQTITVSDAIKKGYRTCIIDDYDRSTRLTDLTEEDFKSDEIYLCENEPNCEAIRQGTILGAIKSDPDNFFDEEFNHEDFYSVGILEAEAVVKAEKAFLEIIYQEIKRQSMGLCQPTNFLVISDPK